MEGRNGEAKDEVPAVMLCLSEIPIQSINPSINESRVHASFANRGAHKRKIDNTTSPFSWADPNS